MKGIEEFRKIFSANGYRLTEVTDDGRYCVMKGTRFGLKHSKRRPAMEIAVKPEKRRRSMERKASAGPPEEKGPVKRRGRSPKEKPVEAADALRVARPPGEFGPRTSPSLNEKCRVCKRIVPKGQVEDGVCSECALKLSSGK